MLKEEELIMRLRHYAKLKNWSGSLHGIRITLRDALARIQDLEDERNGWSEVAGKLNSGEELQRIMKINNELLAELEVIRRAPLPTADQP